MSLPQIFEFDNHTVRTIEKDGDVWFVAKDVAEILGYKNPQEAVRTHCKSVTSIGVSDSLTLDPQTNIIPERDIYRLVMKSKLPSAEKFENWVVSDVLPAIRKTGSYHNIPQPFAGALKLAYEQQLLIDAQVKQLSEAQPKVAFFDAVTESKDAIEIGLAAKVLNMGIGRNKLFETLRNYKILDDGNIPYQKYVGQGYFRVVESKWNKPDGSTHISFKTVVYQRGIEFIRRQLQSDSV
jgi:anti-repressor protein